MAGLYRIREQRKLRRILYIKKHASFINYIRKAIDKFNFQVKPSVSFNALVVMNDMILDVFHQVAREASEIKALRWKRTLRAHDVQFATILCFTGQVSRHAVSEGQRAVDTYTSMNRR